VTVPAGATSANFAIGTQPVTSQFNLNIFAESAGSSQQALLLITAGGGTIVRAASRSLQPISWAADRRPGR
jgi:hypothetical protein